MLAVWYLGKMTASETGSPTSATMLRLSAGLAWGNPPTVSDPANPPADGVGSNKRAFWGGHHLGEQSVFLLLLLALIRLKILARLVHEGRETHSWLWDLVPSFRHLAKQQNGVENVGSWLRALFLPTFKSS